MSNSTNVKQESEVSRRNFLKGLMGAASAATALAAYETLVNNPETLLAQDATAPAGTVTALSSADNGQVDNLERMRAELSRALQNQLQTGDGSW